MLEYVWVWFATVAIMTGVGGLCYIADKALERRATHKLYIQQELAGVYYKNDVGANVKAFGDIEPVSMCGGCGRDIVAGQICPGPDKCENFNQPSLFNA